MQWFHSDVKLNGSDITVSMQFAGLFLETRNMGSIKLWETSILPYVEFFGPTRRGNHHRIFADTIRN